jgi:hypothetical protein
MRAKPAMLLGLTVLGVTLPLCGDEILKPPAQVTSSEHFDFAPGGVIRLDGSFGDLYVEGWDQPRVEMTVTKFMPYEYESTHPERSVQHMSAVRVVAERRSPADLAISTSLPPRVGFLWHPIPPANTRHVTMEYQLLVPRNSRLMIHHGVGYVSISGITGDIEADCHRGDIALWLPESGTYSIDAKSRLGKVTSDFAGSSLSQWLVGQKFVSVTPSSPQKLHLRMGFGGITIKPILPESSATPPVPKESK